MIEPGQSLDDALKAARAAGVERLDAQLLAGHVLQCSRSWVVAHGDEALSDETAVRLRTLLQQRARGVPLAYLTGEKEFHGLRLRVTADVLDPRPDTETLVDWALELMNARPAGAALDLGTGSGAIGLALKARQPAWEVHASDASEAALAVARSNARLLGLEVNFHAGSWWQAVPGRSWDLAVSNPPYIAEGDAHLAGLVHEPRSALVAGADGLDDLRALVAGAPAHLRAGGWLLVEHGFEQGEAVGGLLRAAGFSEVGHRQDLSGHVRCTGGRLAG